MLIENKMFKLFPKAVRNSQKRTLWESEFQRVGADTQKEHEPNWRFIRGTWI